MGGGGGGGRPARAESCHRLGVRRRTGLALGRPQASAGRGAADCCGPHCVGGAGGRCGHAGHGDGPRHAAGAGGRPAHPGHGGAGAGAGAGTGAGSAGCCGPPPAPHARRSPQSAGRPRGAGPVVLHHIHRARRRADAGAGAHPALPQQRPRQGDHGHRLARAGAGRRGRPHRRHAGRHGCDGLAGLLQVCAIITMRGPPGLWYRTTLITFMVAQTCLSPRSKDSAGG